MKRQSDIMDIWTTDDVVTHRVKRIYKGNVSVNEPIWDATDEEAINYGKTYLSAQTTCVEIWRYTGVNDKGFFTLKKIKEIKNEQR